MTNKQFNNKVQFVINQIINNYNPEKIILFGSSASGKTNRWSDADLVIIKSTKKRFYERIGEISSLIDHDIPLDFIVYTPDEFVKMSDSNYFVRDEILKKGKVVYEQ